jgi:hypothetical protein
MSEVIDLTQILRRKKMVRYLTEGIPLDLSPELLEEFKFRLEHVISEKGLYTKHNYECEGFDVDEIEIYFSEEYEIENRLMTIAFIDGVLTFLMPDTLVVGTENFTLFGRIAVATINCWESFEELIKFITQELD